MCAFRKDMTENDLEGATLSSIVLSIGVLVKGRCDK